MYKIWSTSVLNCKTIPKSSPYQTARRTHGPSHQVRVQDPTSQMAPGTSGFQAVAIMCFTCKYLPLLHKYTLCSCWHEYSSLPNNFNYPLVSHRLTSSGCVVLNSWFSMAVVYMTWSLESLTICYCCSSWRMTTRQC